MAERLTDSIVQRLKNGQVGVLRTDTLYGIVGRADNQATVERIYEIKKRNIAKPVIVLIGAKDQLFSQPSTEESVILDDVWPGKTSVILSTPNGPTWLTRGSQTIAYRLPDDQELRTLLRRTGPLIAPSANPEAGPPAINIEQAKRYFGDQVDVYVDDGQVNDTSPSQLLRILSDGTVERLR